MSNSGPDPGSPHFPKTYQQIALERLFEIKRLQWKVQQLWNENVRRREAIEKHKLAMETERIQSYYFDRELWAVLEECADDDLQERSAPHLPRADERNPGASGREN